MRALEFYPSRTMHFDIVQVGCGGNGGYITQRLAKLISSLTKNSSHTTFDYTLVDLDRVEEKNLQRQPFLPRDLDKNKAKVLAERYGMSYQFPIYHREEYVESVEELSNCFRSNQETYVLDSSRVLFRVLIGAVDNHASRKIMHEYFLKDPNIIYIDCGVDGVLLEGTDEEKIRSGYAGHCVVGLHHNDTILAPVAGVYPDILEDNESLLPSQSCGQNIVSQPQRMQSNEMAALITMGYLNQIFAERRLYHHYTNFNALTHSSRATLLPVRPTTEGGGKNV
ncbi:ThiF family adenylyltransferase [Bacillus cereus group sp. TH204-1LC]|uniref:ThiF family adenylyltransferase n=1 Tax=Bacillus cereus group sp. TH204-1LC TaxID=3018054 RepID=UPI0022E0CBB1|nr:ThiF family adenylyltransferase [Bacillus cereus group sp. TH204-1LC]MDA1616437.1 ThiF family adenylyltransferase [Bacillus cereus group sp. TH204-1LC]